MINDITKHYMEQYNVTVEEALKRRLKQTDNGTLTAIKEIIGERIIKNHRLWSLLFPGYTRAKKITSKELQKKGVDYIVTLTDEDGKVRNVHIDLKCCIGNSYSMTADDYNGAPERFFERMKGLTLELYQNGVWTNRKDKLTDYFLYIVADCDGVFYSLIDYGTARRICQENKADTGRYHNHTSMNGSGIYIKYPALMNFLC